jgi:hypothetical protein
VDEVGARVDGVCAAAGSGAEHGASTLFEKLMHMYLLRYSKFQSNMQNPESMETETDVVFESEDDTEAEMHDAAPPFALTRYLYLVCEVNAMYRAAMRGRKREEALFWGYEMYFSGFQVEAFETLSIVFEEDFANSSDAVLGNCFRHLVRVWRRNNSRHEILGTIVCNMTDNPAAVDSLSEIFASINIKRGGDAPEPAQTLEDVSRAGTHVKELSAGDVIPYATINASAPGKAYDVLRCARLFPVLRNVVAETEDAWRAHAEERAPVYSTEKWLYFASLSPVWRGRVEEFGGEQDHLAHTIVFPSEDHAWGFALNYDFDLAHQPREIRAMFALC